MLLPQRQTFTTTSSVGMQVTPRHWRTNIPHLLNIQSYEAVVEWGLCNSSSCYCIGSAAWAEHKSKALEHIAGSSSESARNHAREIQWWKAARKTKCHEMSSEIPSFTAIRGSLPRTRGDFIHSWAASSFKMVRPSSTGVPGDCLLSACLAGLLSAGLSLSRLLGLEWGGLSTATATATAIHESGSLSGSDWNNNAQLADAMLQNSLVEPTDGHVNVRDDIFLLMDADLRRCAVLPV
jgi:hypothetical protein